MPPVTRRLAGESKLLLEQIIDSALDAFIVIDTDSIVIAWTQQAVVIFGWSEEEAIGRSIADLIIPPEYRQAHAKGMRRHLETGRSTVLGRRIEITAQHKAGHTFPIELSINPAQIAGRRLFSAALRDITERKALEEHYRFTFERAPVGIAHLDLEGRVLVVNPKACEILGYRRDELLAMDSRSLSHPADHEITTVNVQRLLSGGQESTSYQKRFIHKDGHILWLKISLSLLREPRPNQGCVIAVFDDMSDVRRAHERAEQLAAVIEATPDFVGFAGTAGEALYINRAGRQMVGLGADQSLAGMSIGSKYPAWAYEIAKRGIEHALKTGSWAGESAIISGEGKEIPTSQVIIAHTDEDGRPQYISTIIRDISERYATEQALRELDRRKDEFLAMLAHELRNPLAPIFTAAQLLKLPGLDQSRIGRASDAIARQAAHMTKLLDDLLDVSRVTRGQIQIERVPVDLSAVAVDAIEQARPLIELRHHALEIRPLPGAITVLGDKTRLVQIFVNILNNAAKYTPDGGTIVFQMAAEGPQVVITVRDNGIGISSDMIPHVFELFTQAKRSPDRSQGGLGLGLALVKRLVELHGGFISAKSEGEGKGSEFAIRLPIMSVAPPAERLTPREVSTAPARRCLRIMVVDDNVDAAQTMAMLLDAAGFEVDVQHDAQTALQHAELLRPQVMLLDIGLPDMDGYELARRLRRVPGMGGAVLIAVTGYGQSEDVAAAEAAGFNHHLLKPADPAKVFALLENVPVK